jgi:ATP-dependent DNA helicase RecQ
MLVLNDVVELPEQDIKRIEEAILGLPEEQQNALKPVYELFDGLYSYGVLRCVRAALQYQTA